jgi:ribosomal protein L29
MGYEVGKRELSTMSDDDVLRETNELRIQLADIRRQLTSEKSWRLAKGESKNPEFLRWLANVRSLNGRMEVRYQQLRQREKDINVSRSRSSTTKVRNRR